MENKIVLIDGYNFLFRSYYATLYSGRLMKNSKGIVTNALYGFVMMLNKVIEEENPKYLVVALDKGKTFRHEIYKDYKAGRQETPDDLIYQLNKANELLDKMGIKHYEVDGYEADDIIGTIAKTKDIESLIVSSDQDLLQLIDENINIKLLKQKDHLLMDEESFKKEYEIDPINIIDMKALSGDKSDNIPGVKGIGDKTALMLLKKYKTLEGVYENIDEIKGKRQENLINDKEDAFFSKKLATIVTDVPFEFNLEEMKYNGPTDELDDLYTELEFFSFLQNETKEYKVPEITYINNINELKEENIISFYIESKYDDYHKRDMLGMGVRTKDNLYFIKEELIKDALNFYKSSTKYTYDNKKNINLINKVINNVTYDHMISSYLLNITTRDDIAHLMNVDNINIPLYRDLLKSENIEETIALKANYIFDKKEEYIERLKEEDMLSLFNDIEMPLSTVLAKMEIEGIICDEEVLNEISEKLDKDITNIQKQVYELSEEEFNISSPKQLGDILFDKLGIKNFGKTKTGQYKTGEDILNKLKEEHEIIELILNYRELTKLKSTYVDGLIKHINNKKIHTIYKQTLTRTGRLSSTNPNLQNIPVRSDSSIMIRESFKTNNGNLLSFDYSQIELRILAHISEDKELIKAFNNNEDIHTKVAKDIFEKDTITPNERRIAKAVIFGIVYGISPYGLSENLGIQVYEAKNFIDKYLELYPGVDLYMKNIIKEAHDKGSVRTLLNRTRVIDEISSTNFMMKKQGERIALNTPIQGTAADIIKLAMVEIDKHLTKNNYKSKMILQVHDELIFDVYDDELEVLIKELSNIMENIFKLDVPLKVDYNYGKSLGDV